MTNITIRNEGGKTASVDVVDFYSDKETVRHSSDLDAHEEITLPVAPGQRIVVWEKEEA